MWFHFSYLLYFDIIAKCYSYIFSETGELLTADIVTRDCRSPIDTFGCGLHLSTGHITGGEMTVCLLIKL